MIHKSTPTVVYPCSDNSRDAETI